MEYATLGLQTNRQHNDFDIGDSASPKLVIQNIIGDKNGRAVDNSVLTVENRMHDAILTAMDKIVFPGVEIAVKSITGSSGHGQNSEVQSSDREDFLGHADNTLLKSIRLKYKSRQK